MKLKFIAKLIYIHNLNSPIYSKKQPSDELTLFFGYELFCFMQKRQREYKYFLCRFLKVFRICCKLSRICPPFTVQIIIIQPDFLLPVTIINTAETMNIKNIANAYIFVESPVDIGTVSELLGILFSGSDTGFEVGSDSL